jgi:hypothetical protein
LIVKRFSLLLLISVLPSLIIAQNKGDFTIGPVFGVNYVTVFGDGIDSIKQQIKDDIEYYETLGVSISGGVYHRTGFNAGFFLDYYFIDNIAFCTGLLYSQKGFVVKNSSELTIGYDYQIKEVRKVNLNYLEFPLLLKYHFKNGIELSGGLLLSFLESDKVITETTKIFETKDSLSGNIVTITEHNKERDDYDDVIDNNDPNALLTGFQIGISYAIKKFNFALKLNKNNSFGKIENIGNNQNITMQFQIGYIFNKRKR